MIRRGRSPWDAAVLVGLWGCAGGDSAATASVETSVRDSAGIEIVETLGSDLTGAGSLRIDPEPIFQVGDQDSALLYGVVGAVRLGNGNIAVANGGSSEILLFAPDGSLLDRFGGRGEGPGELSDIWALLPGNADSLVVHEFFSNGISVFGPTGEFGRSVVNRTTPQPNIAGIDDRGALVTSETRRSSSGSSGAIDAPYDRHFIARRVFPDGRVDTLMVRPLGESRMTVVNGGIARSLFEPWSWASVHGSGLLYGRTDRWEFERLNSLGRTEQIVRWNVAPTRTTPDIVEEHLVGLYGQDEARLNRAREGASALPTAETVPAWARFTFDRTGRLWVQRFVIGATGDPGNDRYRFGAPVQGGLAYVVFSPDGRIVGEVSIPAGVRPLEIGEDYLLGLWLDEYDVEHVRMYRIEEAGA